MCLYETTLKRVSRLLYFMSKHAMSRFHLRVTIIFNSYVNRMRDYSRFSNSASISQLLGLYQYQFANHFYRSLGQ